MIKEVERRTSLPPKKAAKKSADRGSISGKILFDYNDSTPCSKTSKHIQTAVKKSADARLDKREDSIRLQ